MTSGLKLWLLGLNVAGTPGLTQTSRPSLPARSTLPLKQEEYEVSVSCPAGGRRGAGVSRRGGDGGQVPGPGLGGEGCLSSLCALAPQAFLLKLVQNLFAEGNDLFREKDPKQALVQYMEALNVADYAASDQVSLPRELLCKLRVNRAACYFTMVSSAPRLPPPTPIAALP